MEPFPQPTGFTLHIVPAYRDVPAYIQAAREQPEQARPALWCELVLDPSWAEWAGGQFNEKRVREELSVPPTALDELEAESRALAAAGIEAQIQTEFQRIAAELPPPLPEKAVCILPLDPARQVVLEKQNGVLGSCVGDNILLQVHPSGENWQAWVPYVLAHEYNHTVAGFVHFYLKGNLTANLLDSIIFEGLADTFAGKLYPALHPAWTRALTPEQEAQQWLAMQEVLDSPETADYVRFIFGGQEPGSPPPYTGYTIGYNIVQSYLRAYPTTTMADLVMKSGIELLEWGQYRPAYDWPLER